MTGNDLRLLRVMTGLNQEDLAAKLGCTATVISRIERGYRQVSPEEEARILSALGLDSAVLSPLLGKGEKG